MKDFLRWMVAVALVSPLLAGTAHAFNTVTADDGADPGSVYHATTRDKALTDDDNASKSWVHKEGNFSFGMRVNGGNPSSLGGSNTFMLGRGLPDNAAARSFEDSIPKP